MALSEPSQSTQAIASLPYPTLHLVLDEPESVKRNLDRSAVVSLYGWKCGCRAVANGDACDVKWCDQHLYMFASR